MTGAADAGPDVDPNDHPGAIPPDASRAAATGGLGAAPEAEIGDTFVAPGDGWCLAASAADVDVMDRAVAGIEDGPDAVLVRHAACLGYTACLSRDVLTCRMLTGPSGWFAGLRTCGPVRFPDAPARGIARRN